MFASTEPSAFPPAILSRLQRYDVRRLTVAEIEGKLARILAADGREAEPAALHLIARLAAGGMRDAESMLDQLLSAAPERIDEATRPRPARPGRRRGRRDLRRSTSSEATARPGSRCSTRSRSAAGTSGALLDQAVEAIRAELIAGFADPAAARHDPAALVAAARRLAAIDPNRAGIGGLRFQSRARDVRRGAESGHGPERRRQPDRATCPETPRPNRPARPDPGRDTRTDRAILRNRGRHARTDGGANPDQDLRAPADRSPMPRPPSRRPPSRPRRRPTAPKTSTRQSATQRRGRRPRYRSRSIAAPSSAAPALPASPAAADAGLEALLAAWPAIVEQLSQHPPTKPLIVQCRPVAVDGAIVTLGFPEEQAFLKEQAERRRSGIEAGIAEVIGHPVTVRCVVANVELAAGALGRTSSPRRGASSPTSSPTSARSADRRRRAGRRSVPAD